MSLSRETRSAIERIRAEWDRSEGTIKTAEQAVGEAVIPALKELRYAGRRLADALLLIGLPARRKDLADLLADAHFNCHRARHDAIDAATDAMLKRLDAAIDKLGDDVVSQHFPEAISLAARLAEIQTRIAESRVDRENRDAIYSAIEGVDLLELHNGFKRFLYSRERMMRTASRRRRGRFWGIVAVVVSILVALGSLARDLWDIGADDIIASAPKDNELNK